MDSYLKKRIAIQGGSGSYHEIAAILHFGIDNMNTVSFDAFGSLVDSVENQEVDFGLLAIENTVAGSIMPNYSLLKGREIHVSGEILLRIEQNLLALNGQSISEICEVHSHPMALMQCSNFFKDYPHIKLIESDDTANSARRIQDKQLKGIGAIASHRAADLFGLSVLQPGIEANKHNFTRFLVINSKKSLQNNGELRNKANKASISFSLMHKTGSLSKVLSIFSFYNINLSKIQSIPIIGKEWEYYFLVDFVYEDYKIYQQALIAIRPLITELQIMGEYQKAEKYYLSNEITSNVDVETITFI